MKKPRYYAIVDRRDNVVVSVGYSRENFQPDEFINGIARFIEIEINTTLAEEFQEAFNNGQRFCLEDRI